MHPLKVTIIRPQRQQPRPSEGYLRRSFRVGRYTVVMTYDIDGFMPGVVGETNIEWQPDLPQRLTKAELKLYQRRRNEVMQEISNIIGGSVMVADI